MTQRVSKRNVFIRMNHDNRERLQRAIEGMAVTVQEFCFEAIMDKVTAFEDGVYRNELQEKRNVRSTHRTT